MPKSRMKYSNADISSARIDRKGARSHWAATGRGLGNQWAWPERVRDSIINHATVNKYRPGLLLNKKVEMKGQGGAHRNTVVLGIVESGVPMLAAGDVEGTDHRIVSRPLVID